MNMKKVKKISFVLAAVIGLIVFIKLNDGLLSFFERVKSEDAVVTFMSVNRSEAEKAQLKAEIEKQAISLSEKASDAYIDRVFHAIPGYNGIEVDIEATYQYNVNLARGEKIHFIYRETEPSVHLDDLGLQPIYMGNPNKKSVAFMVNVAWGNDELVQILEILKKEDVKLTFFLDGSWLKDNMELAKRIQDEGHELSNHAYSHPDMSKLSREQQLQQITKTNDLLIQLGVTTPWFAPPSGDFNQTTLEVTKELNMHTVLWTLDTIDWKHPPASSVITKINKMLKPGSLVLMHPTDTTVNSLSALIEIAKEKGLKVTTVSETLSNERNRKEVVSPLLF